MSQAQPGCFSDGSSGATRQVDQRVVLVYDDTNLAACLNTGDCIYIARAHIIDGYHGKRAYSIANLLAASSEPSKQPSNSGLLTKYFPQVSKSNTGKDASNSVPKDSDAAPEDKQEVEPETPSAKDKQEDAPAKAEADADSDAEFDEFIAGASAADLGLVAPGPPPLAKKQPSKQSFRALIAPTDNVRRRLA